MKGTRIGQGRDSMYGVQRGRVGIAKRWSDIMYEYLSNSIVNHSEKT